MDMTLIDMAAYGTHTGALAPHGADKYLQLCQFPAEKSNTFEVFEFFSKRTKIVHLLKSPFKVKVQPVEKLLKITKKMV